MPNNRILFLNRNQGPRIQICYKKKNIDNINVKNGICTTKLSILR